MPRRRRLTVAGLMILVAVAALLAAWFRPMTRREAIREAHRWRTSFGRHSFGDPALPRQWRVINVTRVVRGGADNYAVYMVPDGPREDEYDVRVYVDPRRRRAYQASIAFNNAIDRARRAKDKAEGRWPPP